MRMNIISREPSFGFLLHSLELVNHFGPVWDLLPTGSFEIVLVDVATANAKEATTRWGAPVLSADEAIGLGRQYRYLVSNHPMAGRYKPPLVRQLAQHNVRFMYAAGKSGWNLSSWNQTYDAILCFGPFHAEALGNVCDSTIIQMGYPRFDRYFNETPDLASLGARYGCDPAKQTIVWLPTWKTLSSVGHFDEEIGALADRYNIIVKVHPLMPESEPERVEALARQPLTALITDHTDNLPLYQLADYMLFDYGGPPLAALYTDKKFVLLDVPGADQDELTGEESPDVALRRYFTHVHANSGRLPTLFNDEALWDKHRGVRAQLRSKYFAPYFGFSAQVAAQSLMHMDHIVANRKPS